MTIAAPRTDAGHELVVERVFDAPRELVFKVWTDPGLAINWWGPSAYPSRQVEIDLRVGGAWRACLKSVETGDELWHGGVFREVKPPERLVFTFAWEEEGERGEETLVSIVFSDERGRTRMLLRQTPFRTADTRDDHREGWSSTLDRLAEFLATQG
jgi:uncharacterized protein YndB with AHSA1/START domain